MNGNIIFSYTRAQALEDGVLVDVTESAERAGIECSTAVTAAVWTAYVEGPDTGDGEDREGRLQHILREMREADAGDYPTDTILYWIAVRNADGESEWVTLKVVFGHGDDADPGITIMLPEED